MTADSAIAAAVAAAADAVDLQAGQHEAARLAAPEPQPARPDPLPGSDLAGTGSAAPGPDSYGS